ncbi:hypothetical protein [Streptomyces alkaliterrae]|uniref:Uncharacterized protein n=1 Tax=Streptomyces alkaliterrae TaxID=2213162 RepID=A0A7W3WQL0_9ACTN|nr:hypothetical protein [Streptomyces alkaliterrae]MBB1256683.1 hypothetical protein [Streptomyces alkaliterrae]MBB1258955.1 hypothetical protein [Streptomyces alkaliterrae]
MTIEESSRFVRLQVELVLEVADAAALTRTAVAHIEGDELIPDEERAHAVSAVTDDTDGVAEAIAYLVDPIDLVGEAPGVELAQASWSSETVDYDPKNSWPYASPAEPYEAWETDDEDYLDPEGTGSGAGGRHAG